MSVIWSRSGIMKPENYQQAIEMSEAQLEAFKEKAGVRAGLYHQMGGDIGRLGALTVFDDLAEFQKVMREAVGNPEYLERQQQYLGNFLPQSLRETIWVGRGTTS